MDQFRSLLCCWGRYSFDESKMDIIMHLPLELAVMILRFLDPRALLAALCVNRKWLRIVRSDSVLRCRVRTELRAQRLARETLIMRRPTRVAVLDERRTVFGRRKSKNSLEADAQRVQLVVQEPNIQGPTSTNFVRKPIRPTVFALFRRDASLVRAASFRKINVSSRRPQPYSLRSSAKTLGKAKTSNLRL